MDYSEGYIQSGTARIFYIAVGSGEALIMLHGNRQNIGFFYKQSEFFKSRYRIIGLDSRGHGKSSFGEERLTIQLLAEDVKTVIEKLGLENVNVMGFSDGANVAIQLAIIMQNRLKSLVLVSANLYPGGIKAFARIPIKLAYMFFRLMSCIKLFERKEQLFYLMAHNTNISPDSLKEIKAPTLILVGEHDIVKRKHTKIIEQKIASAEMVTIKDTGHMLLWHKDKEANKIILDFLESVSDRLHFDKSLI
jgi:pimeloyl-ACP methyl ester carboxylesterase